MSQPKNDVVLIKHTHATRSNDAIALVDPLADPSAKNIKKCQKTTLDSFVVKKQVQTTSLANKPFNSSVNISPDSSAEGEDLLSFKSPVVNKVLAKSFSSSTPHLKTNFFTSALHNVSTAISHFVAPPVDTFVASNLSVNVDLNVSNSPPGPSPPIIVVTAPNVVQPNNSDSDSEDDLVTVHTAANPVNIVVLGGGTSGLGASASSASSASTVSLIIEGDDSDE